MSEGSLLIHGAVTLTSNPLSNFPSTFPRPFTDPAASSRHATARLITFIRIVGGVVFNRIAHHGEIYNLGLLRHSWL